MRRLGFVVLVLVWLGVACAPPPGGPTSSPQADQAPAQPSRTLIAGVQIEPKVLNSRLIAAANQSQNFSRRLFNADLAQIDDQSNAHPYLAEALPQLNTDSWKVFPDGKMETTYRLKPNLVWHDGTPHTPDDYVFSWQVFTTKELGQASALPFRIIAGIETPDDRTLVIRWNEPYVGAGSLQNLASNAAIGLPPTPRFILGPAYETGNIDTFLNHAYWSTGFVGLGPYRLDRWEPGAFLEATAFERHALGPPKISRIRMLFFTDPGAALASMLSGDMHIAVDNALSVARAAELMRQWAPGRGYIVPYVGSWNSAHFQGRAELSSPPALQDRRVRQALAFSIDRPGINEAIYEGQNIVAESLFPEWSEIGRAANANAPKYPLDLARTAQLMTEAGFTRAPGAEFYTGPTSERFSFELRGSTSDEALRTAMASGWRQVGVDVRETLIPAAQVSNLEVKSQYPGLAIHQNGGGETGINNMSSDNIPTAQNNWRGAGIAFNGYANADLDRLIAAFGTALQPAERFRLAGEIVRHYNTELPALSLYFPVTAWTFSSEVTGVMQRPATANVSWNLHEWALK